MYLCDLEKKLDIILKKHICEEWDNVGLLVGDYFKENLNNTNFFCANKEKNLVNVNSITLALELSMEVIDNAIENKSNLIITHHPLIFSPIKNLISNSYKNLMIKRLIKNNIALYSAHTNFDKINGGLNDYIVELLKDNDFIIEKTLPFNNENDFNDLGRICILKNSIHLKDFALHLKNKLNLNKMNIISKENCKIKKFAIVSGSGAEYIDFLKNKVDLFITGDIKYHNAMDNFLEGFPLIDATHFGTEQHFPEAMKKFLNENLKENIKIHTSNKLKDPFYFWEATYE